MVYVRNVLDALDLITGGRVVKGPSCYAGATALSLPRHRGYRENQ
jgi:hypothetical protein